MATDPNQQNVHITGTDLPSWASETTQQGILNAIKNGDNNIANAIKSGDSNTAKLIGNMNTLLSNVSSISSGNSEAAKEFKKIIGILQQTHTDIIKSLSYLKNKKSTDATPPPSLQQDEVTQAVSGLQKLEPNIKKYVEDLLKQNNRSIMSQAKAMKEFFKDFGDEVTKGFNTKDIVANLKDIKNNLGVNAPVKGDDMLSGLLDSIGLGSGPMGVAKKAFGAASAAYAASQVPFEMMMQQVKDRFEITTELRQSGLIEDLGASFVDTTKAFSDNGMTIVEATQFVREFSNAVGVTGTNAALEFVNKVAYATDIMDRYGVNFSQVAKISGTYLDTLQRTGLLEQISASERDRGMKSFMDAVEGVSMVLKTSLEESAKMIRDYLGRDDISAMLMTNSMQLSQEVINEIGAMAKMGPLGEIIAKGAIDPNRFMLTQEFAALNNPALSGVRAIAEQMMMELRAGRGTDELVARYTKQMADTVANDPLVAQLVASGDAEVSSIVAGLGRMAQTAQDAVNKISAPEVDKAERRRQDAERRRGVALDNLNASVLKTLDNTRELSRILNAQTGIIEGQIDVIDTLATKADGFLASLVSMGATANEMLMGTINVFAQGVADLFPDHHMAGDYRELADTSEVIQEQQRVKRQDIYANMNPEQIKKVESAVEDTEYSTWNNFTWAGNVEEARQRIAELEALRSQMTDPLEQNAIDTYIIEEQSKIITSGLEAATDNIETRMNRLMRERYYESYRNAKIESENGTNTSARLDQEQATAAIKEIAPIAIQERLSEVIPAVNDMSDVSDEIKATMLAQEAVNNMRETGITSDEMKKIIDEMFTNQDFINLLGGNADSLREALLSDLPGITVESLQSPSEVPVLSVSEQKLAERSFVQGMMIPGQQNTEQMQQVYTGVSNIVGFNDTGINATDEQFSAYFDDLQKSLGDSEESKRQMLQILQQLSESVAANKPQLEQKTGSEDIRILTAKLDQLIGALQ